jgi:hypothetical protein
VFAGWADGIDDFVVGQCKLDDVGVVLQVGVAFIGCDVPVDGGQCFCQQVEADGRPGDDLFHQVADGCGFEFLGVCGHRVIFCDSVRL